ncbi:MAG: AMIN domain-containing protein [Mycobacterium sp.]
MMRIRPLFCGALALAVLAGGCVTRKPADELGAEDPAVSASLSAIDVPLDLREFEVVSAEGGFRGVFLKLSRLPTAVTHSSYNNPARIVLDIQGPTGTESGEEVFPGGDSLVSTVQVTRQLGSLRVVLDLQADSPPDYAVFPMADWVMIRLMPVDPKVRPWAHRG